VREKYYSLVEKSTAYKPNKQGECSYLQSAGIGYN